MGKRNHLSLLISAKKVDVAQSQTIVLSVLSGFLFLPMLMIDYVILLWHSMGLPYN